MRQQQAEEEEEGEGEEGRKDDAGQQEQSTGESLGAAAAAGQGSASSPIAWREGEPVKVWLPSASSSYALYQQAMTTDAGSEGAAGSGEQGGKKKSRGVRSDVVLLASPLALAKAVKVREVRPAGGWGYSPESSNSRVGNDTFTGH